VDRTKYGVITSKSVFPRGKLSSSWQLLTDGPLKKIHQDHGMCVQSDVDRWNGFHTTGLDMHCTCTHSHSYMNTLSCAMAGVVQRKNSPSLVLSAPLSRGNRPCMLDHELASPILVIRLCSTLCCRRIGEIRSLALSLLLAASPPCTEERSSCRVYLQPFFLFQCLSHKP
jgi:hypothetical protein